MPDIVPVKCQDCGHFPVQERADEYWCAECETAFGEAASRGRQD